MIEFDRAVLREFATEMLEHVAACEQVLVRAGTEPVYEQDFHLLLRSMHSIKGLARVLVSTDLEKLAHVAESRVEAGRVRPVGRGPHVVVQKQVRPVRALPHPP